MHQLVLLRHGESEWNKLNLFTGWYDCDLTDHGRTEAAAAGEMMAEAGFSPDLLHTSLQVRAIRTANIALDSMQRLWVPVRRSWRLNERHYGELTGANKAETTAKYGAEKVKVWRRSYDVPPPEITAENQFNPNDDSRYNDLPPELLPTSECLADVVARMMPYWFDAIIPDLAAGKRVLVVAHGNSLRALVKHLEGISDDEISEVNIPTGVPLHYELDQAFHPAESKPLEQRYLLDAEAVRLRAEAVAKQASAK
ncbi:phosphoglycerate mutase, BPG-dependent, family 1 [Actinobacteria bacterium IMCC26207]|uniref:phosphoglycerate mutase (2,3-diphosphoglycerate-dependent) n=2 Tax=freshwater metagenome TaxID=449393 RepID=A0A6J7SIW8_9ZZZZ|nr:phosphoglycerate mutase, BPG-dependent, family 1 [Actinobacteria bacterium IMCC26207]MSV49324.1 phosphoglyceromutase [Actinomycetota bacterium]MSY21672.1 phosphoglyceromutase [Actinomycetota bacterium]